MKKIWGVVLVLSALVAVPAFAEEMKKDEMPGMAMDKSKGVQMPPPGLSAQGAGGGMGKMCSMMVKSQMVATDEGGVIVLAGNKLMKYDADLNLVKEVEVKMPMGPMGGKQYPMMGKMTEKSSAPDATESPEKTA